MFVTDEEAERRLNHKDNLSLVLLKNHKLSASNGKGNKTNHKGSRKGVPDLTPFMRELIGTTAHLDTAKSTADAFGVSAHQAHNLKHGKLAQSGPVNPDLEKRIVGNLLKAKDTAADIVMKTLGLVNSQEGQIEIANLGVKDKMEVAGRAAGIIDKLTPKDRGNIDNSTKVVIFAPMQRKEAEFEVVEIESVSRQ